MEYMESSVESRVFDLHEMAWHQPQSSIVTLIQLSCEVLWTKN